MKKQVWLSLALVVLLGASVASAETVTLPADLTNYSSGTPSKVEVSNGSLQLVTSSDVIQIPSNWLPPSGGNESISADGRSFTVSGLYGFGLSEAEACSGKIYFELTKESGAHAMLGIAPSDVDPLSIYKNGLVLYSANGGFYSPGPTNVQGYGTSYGSGSVLGFAVDLDANTIQVIKDGTAYSKYASSYLAAWSCIRAAAGHGSSGGSATTRINTGQEPFAYIPPAGYTGRLLITAESGGESSWIETTSSGSIDLSTASVLNSASIQHSVDSGTLLRGLVSFDGTSSWNVWSGGSWTSLGSLDLSAYAFDSFAAPETVFSGSGLSSQSEPVGRVSGAYYFEVTHLTAYLNSIMIGVTDTPNRGVSQSYNRDNSTFYWGYNGTTRTKWVNGTETSYDHSFLLPGDVLGVKFNTATNTVAYSKNGVWGSEFAVNFSDWTAAHPTCGSGSSTGSWSCRMSFESQDLIYPVPDGYVPYGGNYDGMSNTVSEIEAGLTDLDISEIQSLDFAFSLQTPDQRQTPSLGEISVTYSFGSGTCSDGVQNQDETSVDCGGSCVACPTETPENVGQSSGPEAWGGSGMEPDHIYLKIEEF